MDYSKEITDQFLIRYRELEQIKQNDNAKYKYLYNKYPSELDLFRYIRNCLSHDVIDSNYPFIVSKSCLDLLELYLKEINESAFSFAKRGKDAICVNLNATIKDAVSILSKYNYSYLPVLNENKEVIGIVSGDSIIDLINKGTIDFNSFVKDHLSIFSISNNENAFFVFVKKDTYMYELKELLNNYYYEKKKLGIIFFTKDGKNNQPLLGLLTPWDVLKNQG